MKEAEGDDIHRGSIRKSKSHRAKMIFSVMASPNRLEILQILNSQGLLTYSELKAQAGFRSKKESGKFAYHLRKLLAQSLVKLNRSERKYFLNNAGKLVLNLAKQIEERSIVEGGKSYVRTSHNSIEEFNSSKILQSLVQEGNLPQELAQKMTEEAENKITKYQITNLTSSLIREVVDSVLLEHGHEEYRNKMSRLGLPTSDVQKMLENHDHKDGMMGLRRLVSDQIFTEYLSMNIFPKDTIDSHLSGEIYIEQAGSGSLVPDILFLSIKELIEDGLNLKGKMLNISRVLAPKTIYDVTTILPIIISLISNEASKEIILDELVPLLSNYPNDSQLEKYLLSAFLTSSTAVSHMEPLVYFHINLNSSPKLVQKILSAYHSFIIMTPKPTIGLAINYEKTKLANYSTILSKIIINGGLVFFTKKPMSSGGILRSTKTDTSDTSVKLYPISINLPRIALDSNNDESYFRTMLAMKIKPTVSAMIVRKNEILDLIHRGLNPLLTISTQNLQRSSMSLIINLVGFQEAVFHILKQQNGSTIFNKIIDSITSIIESAEKENKTSILISMSSTRDKLRFVSLDGKKYGKNSIIDYVDVGYSQGITFESTKIDEYTLKSKQVQMCNLFSKTLSGGLLTRLNFPQDVKPTSVKQAIEKMSTLVDFFVPVKKTLVCGNCGFKASKLMDKCSECKSHFMS